MAEETTLEPQKEKQKKTDKTGLAILALTVIIVAALVAFILINSTIFNQPAANVIQEGDCVDLNYIGRYASNNTVFDSSYQYWENKSGGTPQNVFVSLNKSKLPPVGYENYSSGIIDGLMDGLIGLKEGQTTTIGPIPPEKAYGSPKLKSGDVFTTHTITASNYKREINQTVQVVNFTDDELALKWINPDAFVGRKFTMPEGILMEDLANAYYTIYDPLPPYYIWENSSEVTNITNITVLIKTTPTTPKNITKDVTFYSVGTQTGFIFPDATTAIWNDTTITITSSPIKEANYTMNYSGMEFNIIVGNSTTDYINVTVEAQGQEMPLQVNRTITFNRIYEMRRLYSIPTPFLSYIPFDQLAQEIEQAGYKIHKLSGETLLFEVTIEKVYKTST